METTAKDIKLKKGRKSTALMLSALLVASALAGCAGSSGSAKTNDDYAGKTIVGEVTKVSGDSITISVSETLDKKDKKTKKSKEQDTSKKETAVIELDDDTEITKSSGGPGGMPNGQPPEPPSGGKPNGNPPDMKNGQQGGPDSKGGPGKHGHGHGQEEEIEASDIEKGNTVLIELDKNGDADSVRVMENAGGQGQTSNENIEYTAVKEYDSEATLDGETVASEGDDENAVLVRKGGDVTVTDSKITRNSSSSTGGDNASFYGLSAAVLGEDGKTYVKDTEITTDADGGAGIFSYGSAKVYAANDTITTKNGASGGVHVAGGGTLYAWDMNVKTAGQSSAAIRSDRGGGTLVADGGAYTSTGNGSPAIYSTADIAVHDAKLTAKGSEAVCIEGKNSIRLFDSSLTGNMKDDKQNDCTWNVILYQSMSGDAEEGNSTFEMNGGSLKAGNGGMFYTTNTKSTFVLNDVDITYAKQNDFFLKATGNSNARGWGQTGSNGADCDFTAISQEMKGNVVWDKISTLDLYMTDGSTLKGAVKKDNSNAGNGKGGSCKVYLDSTSTWTVTGNSTLTELYNAGTIIGSDGKEVTIKSTDGTVLEQGNSKFTITVKKYSTKDKTTKAKTISSWSKYEQEKPSQLA